MLWLSRNQLDDLSFAEHRLLAAISDRFGKEIGDPAVAGRLKGLQRQLWTQSRMRIHNVLPVLHSLSEAGVELLLLKGAARIALHPEVQRSRAHQDVDIMVRAEQMQTAAQILTAQGWRSARGDSALAAIARAPGARAINFQKLPWGDVDLHRNAYHGRASHAECDADIWKNAQPAEYFGLPVVVPEAAERLALALSHGAWSPGAHSDWLLDAADILARDKVCWDRFLYIVQQRGLRGQIRIGLSFLQAVTGVALPHEVQELLKGHTPWTTLLIGRNEATLSAPLKTMRKVCYSLLRHDRSDRSAALSPLRLAWARPLRQAANPPHFLPQHSVLVPQTAGQYRFSATVIFKAPPLARRIEMELNSADANLARFRIFARPSSQGYVCAKLSTEIRLPPNTTALCLLSSPSKLLAPHDELACLSRYAALPFEIGDASLSS